MLVKMWGSAWDAGLDVLWVAGWDFAKDAVKVAVKDEKSAIGLVLALGLAKVGMSTRRLRLAEQKTFERGIGCMNSLH